MTEITINNHTELLEFIKNDFITSEQATNIVCKTLGVFCGIYKKKSELISITKYFINTFCIDYKGDNPIFLEQKGEFFSIKDIYAIPEGKRIIDKIEAYY